MLTPELAFQLAMGHRQTGRLAEAEALLRQIVALQPHHVHAWHQFGLVVLQQGRAREAVDLIQKAVALQPGNAALHSDLGVAYRMCGELDESIASFRGSLRLQPNAPHTQRNLGDALQAVGRSEEAIASYRAALFLSPTDAGAHNNLGNAYLHLGQLEDAAACYRRAVECEPRLLQAQSNLGDVLTKLDRPEEGLVCAQHVLALDPNFADGHLNMGVSFWRMGHFAEAEACYRRAIALKPDLVDAHLNLGLLLLLHGRYEEGWREYEWHWRSGTHASRRRDLVAPTWDGQPAEGKTILAYCDQGFGDTLQFVRYLPLVLEQSRAARLVVECQPVLLPLLRQLDGPQIEFVPRADSDAASPPHDLHVSFFDFPLVLRRFEPLTMPEPYLNADEEKRKAWRSRLGPAGRKRVGIAWAGNPAQRDDRRRSMKPEMLRPILDIPGITFVNLQFQPSGSLPPSIAGASVLDPREHILDFSDSAALLAELDLIITVDTSVAHLAGALGRPVWVLVSFVPDFRWGINHTNTPWYPSMRLFRQPRPGDWETVVKDVGTAWRA